MSIGSGLGLLSMGTGPRGKLRAMPRPVPAALAAVQTLKLHLNAFWRGLRAHSLGLDHDLVKTLGVHPFPDLDRVAVLCMVGSFSCQLPQRAGQ